MEKHYSFFQNRDCEFFPCHEGVPEEDFNCLFCYCPLYALGEKCGGGYVYTEKGVKSCERCAFPHRHVPPARTCPGRGHSSIWKFQRSIRS